MVLHGATQKNSTILFSMRKTWVSIMAVTFLHLNLSTLGQSDETKVVLLDLFCNKARTVSSVWSIWHISQTATSCLDTKGKGDEYF